jgi:glycosyltransferase involved in cell wall biosynthesis
VMERQSRSVERCAIYAPAGIGSPKNPFGKDVANLGLYRALAQHGGFEEICFLLHNAADPRHLAAGLQMGGEAATRITTTSVLNLDASQRAGTVFRGKADLADLAWLRRRHGADRRFSLVGLVHSIAPPAIRQYIAAAAVAPVQPWDSLICTSPVVRDCLATMFDEQGEFLSGRFGGGAARVPRPDLPLIPLGVDAGALIEAADRPGLREEARGRLALAPDDVLVLWVGRLSFFEKAFPQPMFAAIEAAAQRTGKRLHFAMAGWFPNDGDRERYAEAARVHAPSVRTMFVDGTDRPLVDGLWAGSDIFLSLVDNIQETFGITPIEAMAAGLPVVISDWDGYRATVRHGQEGFLVETLGGPAGLGETMLDRHLFGMDSYQSYVGNVAQHTAVHIGGAAAAIAALAEDPDLRRRMGAAGRARVTSTFDWPVVVGQLQAHFADLAERRAAADSFDNNTALGRRGDPVRPEPFGAFAPFATDILDAAMPVWPTPDTEPARVAALNEVALNRFGALWRGNAAETDAILALVRAEPGLSASRVLGAFPAGRRRMITASLMWLAKIGAIAWQPSDVGARDTEVF